MPRINILTATTLGVDGKTNPLFLGNKKLRWATNLVFEEGVIRTRPGIRYQSTGAVGQFQGAGEYRPSLGLSVESFSDDYVGLVIVCAGNVFINCNKITTTPVFSCSGDVTIFQAENYLILQNPNTSTYWWNGETLTKSPGMQEQNWEDPEMARTEVEIIRPLANLGPCPGEGGGGGGGGGCPDNQARITFLVVNNDSEEVVTGAIFELTRNGNVAYDGTSDGSTTISVEPGFYEFSFTLNGYATVTGAINVVACEDQTINVRVTGSSCPFAITNGNPASVDTGTSWRTTSVVEADAYVWGEEDADLWYLVDLSR